MIKIEVITDKKYDYLRSPSQSNALLSRLALFSDVFINKYYFHLTFFVLCLWFFLCCLLSHLS